MEQEPFAVRHCFGDVDELGEVTRAWDVDFRQLGRGRLEGSIEQWVSPSVQLARPYFSCRIDQRGAPPRQLRTVAIPADPAFRAYWRGQHISGDQLMLFPLGGELECLSASGFEILIVSLEDALLDEAASRIGQDGLSRLLAANEVVTLPAEALGRLRAGVSRLLEAASAGRPAGGAARVHAEVPTLLAEALGAAGDPVRSPSPGARVPVVREVMELIRQRSQDVMTVSEICRLVDVTDRSLQRGFREVAGVSPKQYLLAHRLSGVHRSLRNADPGRTRVADVANEWGFWHMGQLAAHYRRHFGEMPSETLRRGKR